MIRAARGPVVVQGGGTRALEYLSGAVLHTEGLTGTEMYEPGALTLVARAGTALAEVEAALASEHQRLAFEPPDLRALLGRTGTSTIGGVVADNASGPRRVQAGACRDSLLGIRMVDGNGTVIKNGGRVMKNVTGYDLVKLMAGSRGQLGVLSEVSFKVQAMPEAEVTLQVTGLGDRAALAALRASLGSPYDISGAAHLDSTSAGGVARTLIRIEGMAGSVAYRAGRLAMMLGDCSHVRDAVSRTLWHEVRDVAPFAGVAGAVWRLSLTPTRAQDVSLALTGAGIAHRCIWDWAGGRLWLLTTADATPVIRVTVAGIGHATLVRPVPGMDRHAVCPPEAAGIAALTAGLRAAFDPRGVFNQTGVDA